MKHTHALPALCAGFFMSATVVHAAVQTLPTPTPGGFPDAETSTATPLLPWRAYLPQVAITLELDASPTNAVQVAFGMDANGDGDLRPEETEFVVGYDCGEWFTRDERTGGTTQRLAAQPSSNRVSHTFAVTMAKDPADRWDLAKITTRGKADLSAEITATLLKPFFYIVIR